MMKHVIVPSTRWLQSAKCQISQKQAVQLHVNNGKGVKYRKRLSSPILKQNSCHKENVTAVGGKTTLPNIVQP